VKSNKRPKINIEEIRELIIKDKVELPKYASPLINLANRFAQATRPEVVGQMSELVKRCPYKDFEGWKKWYLSKYPNAIEVATNKIINMLSRFKETIDKLDKETVRRWVEDLVLVKTYIGLIVQEPILAYFSKRLGLSYRLATSEEESKGIDGYLDEYAISIKRITYKDKIGLAKEKPAGDLIIYYDKDKNSNIEIVEIKSLTDKGMELLERIRKLVETFSLNDFY